MFILNMFIYKKFMNCFFFKIQDIIIAQMYEIMKIQMHFQSNYMIFC
jgi:hypothetical protein